MLFHWISMLPMGSVAGINQLPFAPQPTTANLIWLAIMFIVLEQSHA